VNNLPKIELGDEVRDVVSGFVGVTTCRNEFLNGCVRFCVCPKVGNDGAFREERWFDVQQLETVKKASIAPVLVVDGDKSVDEARHTPPGGDRIDAIAPSRGR